MQKFKKAGENGNSVLSLSLADFRRMALKTPEGVSAYSPLSVNAPYYRQQFQTILRKFSAHPEILIEAIFDRNSDVCGTAARCLLHLQTKAAEDFMIKSIMEFDPLSDDSKKSDMFVFEKMVNKLVLDFSERDDKLKTQLLTQLRGIYSLDSGDFSIEVKKREKIVDAKIIATQALRFLNDEGSLEIMIAQIENSQKEISGGMLSVPANELSRLEKEVVLVFLIANALFHLEYTHNEPSKKGIDKAAETFIWLQDPDNVPPEGKYFYRDEKHGRVSILARLRVINAELGLIHAAWEALEKLKKPKS